ncbi:MAG: 2-phosphosulfolactate phosphatase [Anaerolineales bacterium]|nr:2-phosphosulfolactate phosphatase [Anaerolineales bacterium]
MNFHYLPLEQSQEARGIVVVIDVLRAFSTAAYAFDAGAESIAVVGTIEEAFEMKREDPELVLIGEKGGWPVDGFDYGNAPSEVVGEDLSGRRIVMRTSAGTQGVVRCQHAGTILAASLVCARATADFIRSREPAQVSFIITGADGDGFGDEDLTCADYITDLLIDRASDKEALKHRVLNSGWGRRFGDPDYPFLDISDIDYCTRIDEFNFCMLYDAENGGRVFKPR